jgi:leader peptidase (prepilin peptidase)/N-methyltransferase
MPRIVAGSVGSARPVIGIVVIAGLFGLVVGSFLNVVMWRVPRGESVINPPSHCTACGTHLGPVDLVPVASWVALRGRCRHCGTGVSARYPMVELATAIAFALVAWLVVR